MGPLALACAALGVLAVLVPGAGKYLAIGLGFFAAGAGVVGYRRGSARARLAAAGGIALGLVALVLGFAKVGLTWMALERLRRLL